MAKPYGMNANGTLVPINVGVDFLTGTSVNGMTAGNKVLWKDTLGNIEVFDGVEAHAHLICGVSDGTAVVAGGTVTYMPVDGVLPNLNPFFTVGTGELYAKDDGTLGVISSLTPGKASRRIGTLAKNDGSTLYLDFDTVFEVT